MTALNLEEHYDKDTIIEAYLNTLYLGSGCYGVKTASQEYFGKDVSELNAAECAVIASITQAPTKWNPLLNPENNRERQLVENMIFEEAVNQIESKSMTMIPIMFWGAFLMHHPHMTREQTDKILFDGLGGLGDAEMTYLGKLYAEPFKTLVAREEEGANPRKMTVKF